MTEQQIERIDQKREANKADHDRQIEDIRREPDFNEEAKTRHIQEIHTRANAKDKELFEEKTNLIAQDYDRRVKETFAPPKVSGADPANVALSYRDALGRVQAINDQRESLDVLERAERTSDDALAKACLSRAYDREFRGVIDAYFRARPDAEKSWERLMQSTERLNAFQHEVQMFGRMGPQKPRELERWNVLAGR